ncbi:SinI family autotransporter-associated protein [Yersinia frederiksenii]|uniref:SinI family autotransporter-associated protein n=1 Tax=Yersinia frederiksenii TaxID=29484 RepID=UPI0005E91F60|nr:SinI family autotransporter-associated protein [Yersinia frederiksenii]CQJ05547.1 intimin-like protein SinH [Yersinia frederiksenii]
MNTIKARNFTLKKIALALMIAVGTVTAAHAALTGSTGTVQGEAPTLKAASNNAAHAVSFSASDPAALKTGDTITMTYKYTDTDGDTDDSTTTVQWYYVPGNGTGTPVAISGPVNTLASGSDGTGMGSSSIVIPDAAVGARIKAAITEKSLTGDPREGFTITYNDVSKIGTYEGGPDDKPATPTDPTNPDVPDLPVAPGSGLVAMILEVGGDGTSNLIGSETKLKVGNTYQFKLFASDGVTDLTDTVNYQWKLTGTSATTGTAAPTSLFNPDANFLVPTNTAGKVISGSDDGVQGYGLQVDYNPKP